MATVMSNLSLVFMSLLSLRTLVVVILADALAVLSMHVHVVASVGMHS